MKFLKNPLKPLLLATCIAASLPLAAHAMGPSASCGGAAGHEEPGFGGPEGHGAPPFLGKLKLTEAQRDQLFKNMHEQAPLMREKFKEARKAREALRSLTFSSQYDETKVAALAESEAQAMAELAKMRANGAHQMYQLLTPEQRKQMEDFKKDGESPPRAHHRDGGMW